MRDKPFLFGSSSPATSPVGERAVRTAQVRAFQRSRGQRSRGLTIDVHAEPGDLGGDRASALDAGAADEHIIEVGPGSVVVLLLYPEGRAGGVKCVQAAVITGPRGLWVAVRTKCASAHPAIFRASVIPPTMPRSGRTKSTRSSSMSVR